MAGLCDCIASGNELKPKQHGSDPHAKNCRVYTDFHLEPEAIAGYIDGRLSQAERDRADAHLFKCRPCMTLFANTLRTVHAMNEE